MFIFFHCENEPTLDKSFFFFNTIFSDEKTKYVRLITSVDAIWKARQIYYLANGEYAPSFDNLDISLQGEGRSSNCFSSVLKKGQKISYSFSHLYSKKTTVPKISTGPQPAKNGLI